MNEILQQTFWNEFDMCRMGDLKDPQTGEAVRKRLTVLSTSKDLHVALHGKVCSGQHHHRPIAGNTKVDGHTVKMSQWTENYPQKFARQVGKIIMHDQPPQFPIFAGDDEHPTKRRRLGMKLSPQAIAARFASPSNESPMSEPADISWQTVMSCADRTAPRVGTLVVEQGEIIQLVQQMCPDHSIKHVVSCRGTDRYVGPNKPMIAHAAPLRRQICIRRHTGTVHADEWESWEALSKRALRKKGTPARVSLTIFAASSQPTTGPARDLPERPVFADAMNPSAPRRLRDEPSTNDPEEPLPKRPCNPQMNPNNISQSQTEVTHQDNRDEEPPQHVIDLASQKHGPLFQELSAEEQNWLLKLHRNLGHPGSAKLVTFCKQLQCPDHVLKGISDMRCSTCQEMRGPTISRPSAIHEPCDFGDIVSMDGITWTNKNGDQYHFYHFIDQSTLFHTAVVSPGHSTDDACKALISGWFNWAGPPGLLCVDSGTELNSEEFGQFLQRHSVKCRTCAAEAHWQNSRTELHGGILQLMLNKIDHEQPIGSYEELSVALSHATSTKNQWSKHRGYPPEMLVFGRGVRVPGSITSDPTVSAHATALSNLPDGARFRQDLATREAARKAFAEIDNDQTLRRAIVHRSRPHRGFYDRGDWVMMWKKKGEAEGNWIGPMQVIIQEGQNVIWVTRHHKLYRVPPEYVRSLSAFEEFKHHPMQETQKPADLSIRPTHGGVQFHDMLPHPTAPRNPESTGADPPTIGTSPGTEGSSPAEANGPNMPEPAERPAVESPKDQPDQEPDITSISSRSPSHNFPDNNPQVNLPAHEVPLPETSDEGESLYVDEEMIFNLHEDHCYHFEVEINQRDIDHWKEETRPEEMSFLVSAAKRQRSEVKISTLSPKDRQLFEDAKSKEVDSWLATSTVCRILRNQVPAENILRCRWILTWKDIDEGPSTGNPKIVTGVQQPRQKPKARLVVLGFEDPMVDQIPRDGPTMSKLSRVLILQHAASLGWDIHSFDIKTAFLRGTECSDRVLGMEPPAEMRTKLKLRQDEIVRLLKGDYGRVDAPFLWFQELKQSLEKLGFETAPFDPCTFILRDKQGKPEGMIGIHVDDGLCCGSAIFHKRLAELEAKYPFGSKRSREFTFTGLKIVQQKDQSIWVSQEQYVKDIHPITIPKERRQTPNDPVNETERQSLRALVGSLQYAAVNTRPDLCSKLGWLQSQINKCTISTLLEANKILHEAKMFANVTIKIQPIPIEHLRFVAFSDASFASEKVPDSHQGMIIMASHKDIGENKNSPVNPVVWHSKKIQKVVVSTLSAEAMSLAGAVDILSWVRLYWAWLQDGSCRWQQADETLLRLPPAFAAIPPSSDDTPNAPTPQYNFLKQINSNKHDIITTDCKSLYDLISRHAPPSCQEFRTQLQAKLIKEHLNNGIMIRWVPSQAQLADALTKCMDASVLRACMEGGRYSLHDEAQILRARSDSRARMQWLRTLSDGSKTGDKQ